MPNANIAKPSATDAVNRLDLTSADVRLDNLGSPSSGTVACYSCSCMAED